MSRASRSRLSSIAVHSAFRGVFVEYETDDSPHVLQIGFRTTLQELDHLVQLVEKGIQKFLRQELDDVTQHKLREIVTLLLKCQLNGTPPHPVSSGSRLRVSHDAVVVDVLDSCPVNTSIATKDNRKENTNDLVSSWRIKATIEEDPKDFRDVEDSMDLYVTDQTKRASQDLTSGLFVKKQRNIFRQETFSDDPLDAMLYELGNVYE